MPLPSTVSTADLMAALATRFAPPTYVFLREVRDATGYEASRAADAIAMGVWPSRGLDMSGFEVKASRSDWRRELKNPTKAESIAPYCDRWYVVAPSDVVPADQVPPSWGLMELRGSRLITALEARTPLTPRPLDRSFLASLLRCANKQPEKLAKAARDEGYREGFDAGAASVTRGDDRASEDLEELKRKVREFEAASGIHIGGWNAGDVAAAVRLLTIGRGEHLSAFGNAARDLHRIATDLLAGANQADHALRRAHAEADADRERGAIR